MINPTQPADELFELELRIAQRADELVRRNGIDPFHALEQWRQAEREVWKEQQNTETTVSFCGEYSPRSA